VPYSVTSPDGYTLNGIPDNLDPNSVEVNAELAKLRAKDQKKETPVDRNDSLGVEIVSNSNSGILENVLKGFGSGVTGMLESSALGIATILEEESELKARSKIKDVFDIDVLKGGDQDSILYKLSAGIGSIAALAPAALAGPAALPLAGVVAGGAGAGEASERARAYGATEDERGSASLKGFGIGLTELAPLGRITKGFSKALATPKFDKGVDSILEMLGPKAITSMTSRVKNIAATTLVEGAQEGAAAILQNLNEQGYNAEKELVDAGVLEEALIGGGAGGILQALADTLIKGKDRGTPKLPVDGIKTDTETPAEPFKELTNEEAMEADVREEEANAEVVTEADLNEVTEADLNEVTEEERLQNEKMAENADISQSDINAAVNTERLGATETGEVEAETGEVEAEAKTFTSIVEQRRAVEGLKARAESIDVDVVADMDAAIAEGLTFDGAYAEVSNKVERARENAGKTDEEGSGDSVSTDPQVPSTAENIVPAAKEFVGGRVDSVEQGPTDTLVREEGEPASVEEQGLMDSVTLDKLGQVEGGQTKARESAIAASIKNDEALAKKRAKEKKYDDKPPVLASDTIEKNELKDRGAAVGIDVQRSLNNYTSNKEDPNTGKKYLADAAVVEVTREVEAAELNLAEAQIEEARKTEILNENIPVSDVDAETSSPLAGSNVVVDKSFLSDIGLTGDNKRFGDALLAKFGPDTGNPVTNKELAVNLRDTANIQDRYKLTYTKAPTEGQEKGSVVVKSYETRADQTTAARKAEEAGATDIKTPVLSVVKLNKKAQAYVDTYAKTEGSRGEGTPDRIKQFAKLTGTDLRDEALLAREGKLSDFVGNPKTKGDEVLLSGVGDKRTQGEKDAATEALVEKDVERVAIEKAKDLENDALAREMAQAVFGEGDISLLPANYINELDGVASEKIQKLVKQGKLAEALTKLASTSVDPRVKRVASVLSAAVGNAKVRTADGTDSFVSEDGTVNIPDGPVFIHTLLHEATHSALNGKLDNPSNPVTKKLTAIFNEVKPQLDSAYGATNLKEFVSEVMSNSEFQQKLAGMNTDGSPISVLSRIFRVITNFMRNLLGMNTKTTGSALDATDQAIIALLSTSPETRGAGSTYANATRDGVKKVVQELGLIQKGFPAPTPKFKEQFGKDGGTWLDSVESMVTKLEVLQLLDSQAVGDVARARGFGDLGDRLHKMIQKMRGKQNESDEYIKERVTRVADWARANPEKNKTLGELIYSQEFGATIHQVDPTLTEDQARKKYGLDSDAFITWKEQRKYWDALGKDGQTTYVYLRDTYRQQYIQMERVITGRMESVLGEEAAEKLQTNVFDKMFDRNTLDVYFPLVRHGKYKLSYVPAETGVPRGDHENYVVEMFETKNERILAEAKAKQAGATKIKTSDGDITAAQARLNAPDVGFVSQVLAALTKANVEDSVQDEVINLFIDSLPETAFAQSLRGRSGIAGYEKDPLVAMRSKAFDIGRQTQRIDYAGRIRGIASEIAEVTGKLKVNNPNSGTTSAIGLDMMERATFAVNGAADKKKEGIMKTLNQVAFIYTIGFNASSALVNLSQLPLVVGPMLGAEFGHEKSGRAMTASTALVTSSGNNLLKFFDQSMNKKTGEFEYALKKGLDPKIVKNFGPLTTLITMSAGRSYLTQSYLADAMGIDEGTQTLGAAKEKLGMESSGRIARGNVFSRSLNSLSAISAVMFNSGEKFNRQVTLISAYKLSLERIQGREASKKKDDQMSTTDMEIEASEDALYKSMEYNGGAVLETGSRISAQGYGRVAFMYKNYGLRMYTTMFKTGKEALELQFYPPKNETAPQKEERMRLKKVAWGKLRAIHLSSLLIAGVQGMPLYGAVSALMDLYLDDDEEDADTVVRKYFGEGWFKGPAVEALGVDFSKRVRLNSLLFEANRYSRSDSLEEDIFYHFGGPAFSTGKRIYRAYDDFSEGELERGVENLLPAGVTNILRNSPIGRYQKDGAMETRRGDVIYDDLTAGDFFAGIVGFPPVGYTFAQEQTNIEQGISKTVTKERSKLLKQYYVARRQGDYSESKRVFKEMREFGKKHPSAAISYESLKRSYKGHQRTTAKMYNGTTLSPMMKSVLEADRKEYDQTSSLFD